MSLGAFPSQIIREMIENGSIGNADKKRIQPASLDLTISGEIYKMKGIFLPRKGETIRQLLSAGTLFPTDLGKPLECFGVYLVRLNEKLNLPEHIFARANNKSSSGRINLQARLMADGVPQFDNIPRGYKGELWLMISPQSFSVNLREGDALNQIRFFNFDTRLTKEEYNAIYEPCGLLYDKYGKMVAKTEVDFNDGITMTVDLEQPTVGYKCASSSTKVLDFNRYDHDPLEYFEPIHKPQNGHIVLRRSEFYILSTKESIRIPNNFAVEMIAYDTSKGEFRSHYAGFFDPGWGYGKSGEKNGDPAVLEVFTYDNDFILRDGQPICKMVYEKLSTPSELIYGSEEAGSHYFGQKGPRLSKHFKME